MSEADWGDLESLPEPKSGVPRWLWACGCGCLLIVILLGSGAFWTATWIQEGRDPEHFWSGLREVIEHDERPAGFEPMFGNRMPIFDVSFFLLQNEETNTTAIFFVLPAGTSGDEAREEMLNPESSGDAEQLTLEVQGRQLQATRAKGEHQSGYFPSAQVETDGQSLMVDLTRAGDRPLILLYSHASKEEPVPVEEVVEFLRPFHVGPDR